MNRFTQLRFFLHALLVRQRCHGIQATNKEEKQRADPNMSRTLRQDRATALRYRDERSELDLALLALTWHIGGESRRSRPFSPRPAPASLIAGPAADP